MGERRCDVVVVGGGAMGLATAWWLAPQRKVILLERFEPGHRRGASHGDERIFRYLYPDPIYVRMVQAADEGWARLERDSGRQLLHRVGSIEHGDATLLDAIAAAAGECGVPTERLDAGEAARQWPGMRFDGQVLSQPSGGWVHAAGTLTGLAELTSASGAELRFEAPVTGIQVLGDDGVRVRCGDDVIRADVVVVTAGAWTEGLLPDLGLPPLVTTEEHVFFFRYDPAGPGPVLPSFIHDQEPIRYGLEGPRGLVKLGEHHTGTVTTGDDRTGRTDPERVARIERYVAEWLPGLVPHVVDATTCLYTSTPTYDFVLDRVGPVVVGAGFSGHGFKFVPEVGRRLGALVTGDATPDSRFRALRL